MPQPGQALHTKEAVESRDIPGAACRLVRAMRPAGICHETGVADALPESGAMIRPGLRDRHGGNGRGIVGAHHGREGFTGKAHRARGPLLQKAVRCRLLRG